SRLVRPRAARHPAHVHRELRAGAVPPGHRAGQLRRLRPGAGRARPWPGATARPSDTARHGAGDEDGRRVRPRDPRPTRDPRLTSHSHPNPERNPMTTQTLELDDLARTATRTSLP